jgi:hypothetical protein
MVYCNKVKKRNLTNKLLSLDIDEGLRIESSVYGIRLFINKSASGTFVLQFCNNNKDDKENRNNNFVYFDSAEEVIKLIKIKFGRNFSVWSY